MPTVVLQTENLSIIYTSGLRVLGSIILCGHFKQPEE